MDPQGDSHSFKRGNDMRSVAVCVGQVGMNDHRKPLVWIPSVIPSVAFTTCLPLLGRVSKPLKQPCGTNHGCVRAFVYFQHAELTKIAAVTNFQFPCPVTSGPPPGPIRKQRFSPPVILFASRSLMLDCACAHLLPDTNTP